MKTGQCQLKLYLILFKNNPAQFLRGVILSSVVCSSRLFHRVGVGPTLAGDDHNIVRLGRVIDVVNVAAADTEEVGQIGQGVRLRIVQINDAIRGLLIGIGSLDHVEPLLLQVSSCLIGQAGGAGTVFDDDAGSFGLHDTLLI